MQQGAQPSQQFVLCPGDNSRGTGAGNPLLLSACVQPASFSMLNTSAGHAMTCRRSVAVLHMSHAWLW